MRSIGDILNDYMKQLEKERKKQSNHQKGKCFSG